MRQSYYPQQQQQSQYDSNHSQQNRNQQSQQQQQPPLTGAAARLANKQKELQGLKLLREHSNKMADDIEKLADQVDLLVKGGDCEYTRLGHESQREIGDGDWVMTS